MSQGLVHMALNPPLATVVLNDPARRNALGSRMFDELERSAAAIAAEPAITIVLLRGEGGAFCSGFDLPAAVADPSLLASFIERLSGLLRAIRRLPQIVVACVDGPAIAGGCALVSACDFVVVAADAKLGYPVHRIGVSPAVTIPTLEQRVDDGAARALLMSGELIDGVTAHRLGLASHLAASAESALARATELCGELSRKGPHALRATKAWLNELDGSLLNDRFDGPVNASAAIADSAESRALLAQWASRSTS